VISGRTAHAPLSRASIVPCDAGRGGRRRPAWRPPSPCSARPHHPPVLTLVRRARRPPVSASRRPADLLFNRRRRRHRPVGFNRRRCRRCDARRQAADPERWRAAHGRVSCLPYAGQRLLRQVRPRRMRHQTPDLLAAAVLARVPRRHRHL